jgi:putative transcriptional regulator
MSVTLEIIEENLRGKFPISMKCPDCHCFNLATKVNEKSLLMKITDDASKIPSELALELSLIADKLSAIPLIIGNRLQNKRMADHVLYIRYGMYAINLQTFFDIVLNGNNPLVEAKQGGFSVYIDCDLMKNKMRELRITRGDLSNLLGISRKALYTYERGTTKCTLAIAMKLELILGAPIIKALNPFEWRYKSRQSTNNLGRTRQKIGIPLKEMVQLFEKLKLTTLFTRNAPFDFVLRDETKKIVGNIIIKDDKASIERVKVAESVARVLKAHFLPVSLHGNIESAIPYEKLKEAKSSDDLITHSL